MARALEQAGHRVRSITRREEGEVEQPLPPPIVVATRLADLEPLICRMHPANHLRLVLVQNGFLVPVIERLGLDPVTTGVLYFAATDRTSLPRPGLPSLFCGPDAVLIVRGLQRGGIPARVVPYRDAMLEQEAIKLLWLSAVAGLSAALKIPVDQVVMWEKGRLEALLEEMLPAAAELYQRPLEMAQVLDLHHRYSLAIAGYQGSGGDLSERNLLLWQAGARGPVHRWLLETLGVNTEGLETPGLETPGLETPGLATPDGHPAA